MVLGRNPSPSAALGQGCGGPRMPPSGIVNMVHLLTTVVPPLAGLLSFFAISVGSFLSLLANGSAGERSPHIGHLPLLKAGAAVAASSNKVKLGVPGPRPCAAVARATAT